MGLNNINPVKAFTRILLFVVDTSSGMVGTVKAVNRAIESVISSIKNASDEYPELNVQFKAAILEFWGENAIMSIPEDITTYKWKNLETKNGIAKFSVACKKLNEVLASGIIAYDPHPGIILIISPGFAVDGPVALNELKRNPRFMQAYKVAIGVGNFNSTIVEKDTDNGVDVEFDAGNSQDMKVLDEFTGIKEYAIDAFAPQSIHKVIRDASFKAAQFGLEDKKFDRLLKKDSNDG